MEIDLIYTFIMLSTNYKSYILEISLFCRSIFSCLHDVQLKQSEVQKEDTMSRDTTSTGSVTPGKKTSPTGLADSSSKVDKRLNEVYVS